MVFLEDYESLRLLNSHINNCDLTQASKTSAKAKLSNVFRQIIFALCTFSVHGIVKSSTHATVNQSIASPTFNSLAFLVLAKNKTGGKSYRTFSFYGGLKKFSSPLNILTNFKIDIMFLRDFGVNLSISILSPTDMAKLCFMQRHKNIPTVLDIHGGFSYGHLVGEYSATFGGDILSIFNLISQHFTFQTLSPDTSKFFHRIFWF
jgi:hypothetical protein